MDATLPPTGPGRDDPGRDDAGPDDAGPDDPGPDESRPDVEALRRTAVMLATEAAALLRERPAPRDAAVTTKSSPTDVVTASDTAVETFLRERLAALRPGEPVVGEEQGGVAGSGLAWVVDPIDGTVNYLYGLPWFAVSVAAVRAGATLAGAVAEPVSGRLWSAAHGRGASCDGAALAVSGATETELALVGTGFAYRAQRRVRQARLVAELLPRVRDVRRTGSAALDLCAVAAGWIDAYVEHGTNWWDWAAAALIAREAGATVRVPGPPGTPAPRDGLGDAGVLAATPALTGPLGELLRELDAGGV